MPDAARVGDMTSHGPPLNPGIGSLDVLIGYMPAWRALPAGVGAGLEAASKAMDKLMKKPVLTPSDTTPKLVKVQADMTKSAGKAASKGNASASGTTSASYVTLTATNVTLTATWTTASAAPGGQPAANAAYTLAIKAAAAVAASAAMAAVAGMVDTNICPIPCPVPPHGPGVVVKGSKSVFINNFPAARKDDKVIEACGGANAISMGCTTVIIGDEKGGGGGGGGGKSGKSGGGAGSGGDSGPQQAPGGDGGSGSASSIASAGLMMAKNIAAAFSGRALCEVCDDSLVSPDNIHTGEEGTPSLGAEAYTTGNDVSFGSGLQGGEEAMLGHELTHVVQQGQQGTSSPPPGSPTGGPQQS